MYCVWRAYLEGTIQVTQSRISACDNYKIQVADPAKTARLQKEQQLRKVMQTSLSHFYPFNLINTMLPYRNQGVGVFCISGVCDIFSESAENMIQMMIITWAPGKYLQSKT